MNTTLHKANTRGQVNLGWLQSQHSFSFGHYHNPERMNFGLLRVLNDDIVQPKMGFGTHPHKNMEIISIPLSGALSHKDSMGNKKAIEVGEVQVMSAGSGITHSEFNDSIDTETNFLQLWILPEILEISPVYDQKTFEVQSRKNNFQVLVSPVDKAVKGSLTINQQAYISIAEMDENTQLDYLIKDQNGVYVFLIEGNITVAETQLESRDALGVWETKDLEFQANTKSTVLVIDVPMGL
ncbi:hypothetical protein GCM10011416_18890 [Polaribacter pacificus]|uniref:Pirin family protein n=1 Tax=Polaribacter pacificus TaxID=1775173 RepID=A0A917I1N5_9FLAO|nr:pirin family protein [Polaribacter pacificus]GGH00534.1 hypothetical protein GCM10011416_18890 [Polaribacter pacificus]